MLNSDTATLILDNLSAEDCVNCLLVSKQFHVYHNFPNSNLIKGFKHCLEHELMLELEWYIKKMCCSCSFSYGYFVNISTYIAILSFQNESGQVFNEKRICHIVCDDDCHLLSYRGISQDLQIWSEYIPADIFIVKSNYLLSDSTNYNYLALVGLLQLVSNFCTRWETTKKCKPHIKINKKTYAQIHHITGKRIIRCFPGLFSACCAVKFKIDLSDIKEVDDALIFKVIECEFIFIDYLKKKMK
jgi:hypothetical protein